MADEHGRGSAVLRLQVPFEDAPMCNVAGSLDDQASGILSAACMALWGDASQERVAPYALMVSPTIYTDENGVIRSTWTWAGGVSSIRVTCEAHRERAWAGLRLVDIDCRMLSGPVACAIAAATVEHLVALGYSSAKVEFGRVSLGADDAAKLEVAPGAGLRTIGDGQPDQRT